MGTMHSLDDAGSQADVDSEAVTGDELLTV
jgi:hypothetical protein